ncbi:hypothetical protein AB0877_05160 [Micromonospora sp. NPDC047644]|uniref:hypothetical protein n=1 Tax=Micromonospora sp. NPDC047644 TaxID=3157203 RepID=UPI00345563CE
MSRAADAPPRPDPAAPPDRHPHAPAPFTAEFDTAPPVAAGPASVSRPGRGAC